MRLRDVAQTFQACQRSISIQALVRGLLAVRVRLAAIVLGEPVDVRQARVGLDLDDAALQADVAVPVSSSSTVSETRGSWRRCSSRARRSSMLTRTRPSSSTGTRWRRVSGAPSGFSVAITAGMRLAQERLELVGERRLGHARRCISGRGRWRRRCARTATGSAAGSPSSSRRSDQQAAVLPDAVVVGVVADVALVLVHVVDAARRVRSATARRTRGRCAPRSRWRSKSSLRSLFAPGLVSGSGLNCSGRHRPPRT